MAKLVQMKRQGRGRQVEPFTDLPGWYTFRPCLHQQSKYIEARVLSERREGGYCV